MTDAKLEPVQLYGSSISYFTGKMENYFRLKGIAYELRPMLARSIYPLVQEKVGATQMPAMTLADGRWLTDTTPAIQWFETEYPDHPVIPQDPLQRFFSLLLEDYADEWLWRPAMHYRWYYDVGATFAGAHLVQELTGELPLPKHFKRWMIRRRQRSGYTFGDGITRDQVPAVESIYHRTLEQLQAILETRPFLLGDSPSLADVGFSAPFFRHFGLDPVPAEIMRKSAPAVMVWITRLWNTRLAEKSGEWLDGIPEDWNPLLQEIGEHYLPYLCANVEAVAAGTRKFDAEVGGVRYRGARWSPYRVWCLQRLREEYRSLPEVVQLQARERLEQTGCWEPLWRPSSLPLADGFCARLPFYADAKMIDVYHTR
ncbi:MAG: glutathione S-transferase family protein [Pseudomonadota bacterium]